MYQCTYALQTLQGALEVQHASTASSAAPILGGECIKWVGTAALQDFRDNIK